MANIAVCVRVRCIGVCKCVYVRRMCSYSYSWTTENENETIALSATCLCYFSFLIIFVFLAFVAIDKKEQQQNDWQQIFVHHNFVSAARLLYVKRLGQKTNR